MFLFFFKSLEVWSSLLFAISDLYWLTKFFLRETFIDASAIIIIFKHTFNVQIEQIHLLKNAI